MEFAGFKREAFAWFEELEANNNRAWFAENRATYEHAVRDPLDEVTAGAAMGLYRATASGHWILDKAEDPAGGRAGDHRIAVRP